MDSYRQTDGRHDAECKVIGIQFLKWTFLDFYKMKISSPDKQQKDENSTHCSNNGLLIFSAPLSEDLEKLHRLPPTYVGARRVRASHKAVLKALKEGDADNVTSPTSIVYKVVGDNGIERRMSNQEKKQLKIKLRMEKKLFRKQQKTENTDDTFHRSCLHKAREEKNLLLKGNRASSDDIINELSNKTGCAITSKHTEFKEKLTRSQKRRYYQLELSNQCLEEEVNELKGVHHGVPPAVLSFPMASRALHLNLIQGTSGVSTQSPNIVVDNELAEIWANKLIESITAAEDSRSKENMRPMAYRMVPEVWERLRPSLKSKCSSMTNQYDKCKGNIATANIDIATVIDEKQVLSIPNQPNEREEEVTYDSFPIHSAPSYDKSNDNVFVHKTCIDVVMRPPLSDLDEAMSIVYQSLYCLHPNLHVSCGAKFGSDFILYDGLREKRHGFAGLRVYALNNDAHGGESDTSNEHLNSSQVAINFTPSSLPLLSAYDVAGYVRGLNTAGKLALIATVVKKINPITNETIFHVAFVDLALEKILSAHTHKKKRDWATMQKRKNVGDNLEKKPQSLQLESNSPK